MTTLNDVVASIADQLARNDLNEQIIREVGLAVTRYSRKLTYLTELRAGTVLLEPQRMWYDTINLDDAQGYQNRTGNVPASNIISLDFVRYATPAVIETLLLESGGSLLLEDGAPLLLQSGVMADANERGLLVDLMPIHHREFEQRGMYYAPFYRYGYCLYAGQFGVWPEHSGTAIYFSGHVKPVVPTNGGDGSVFFDEARELIEAAAAKGVCVKYIMDVERATAFAELERIAMNDIQLETNVKASTGRLQARW